MASGVFLRWGVLERGLGCGSSCGRHSTCTAWGRGANWPKHVQNTANFKCNYGVACFYPGFSGNTLNLTGPIKKKKFLSSMLTWRPLAIFYSAGPRLDVTGTEITRGHFFDPVPGGVSDRCPLAWPLLESNCCGRGTLAAVRWAELLGYFPGEGR